MELSKEVENKGLSLHDLELIRNFVRTKGYFYHEVVDEMVDHLACEVEKRREVDPQISVDKAISDFHSSFGIFGFSDWEQGIIKQTGRKVRRITGRSALAFFKWPKIQFTITIALIAIGITMIVQQLFFDPFGFQLLVFGGSLMGIGWLFVSYKKLFNKSIFETPNSLLLQSTNTYLIVIQILGNSLGINVKYFAETGSPHTWWVLSFSLFLVMMSVAIYYHLAKNIAEISPRRHLV